MARLPQALCVILTVWLAASRPTAAGRAESPDSGEWWGSGQPFEHVVQESRRLRQAGDYAALEPLYRDAIVLARQLGNLAAEITYHTTLGNSFLWRYRYAEAIQAYQEASRLARASQKREYLASIATGLSSAYFLTGDLEAARAAAREGLEALSQVPGQSYPAQLLVQYARLQTGPEAIPTILATIDAARAQGQPAIEAYGWDLLGDARLASGDTEAAEAALGQALRLRRDAPAGDVRFSYWRLGRLRLAQARAPPAGPRRDRLLAQAARFTGLALAGSASVGQHLEQRILLQQRGRILSEQGQPAAALRDFAAAVAMGERWRLVVPPASGTLTAADIALDHDVYRTFVEAAASHAAATSSDYWAAQAFLAVERNRAASLRDSRELAAVWRQTLPPRYWDVLAELRRVEAAQVSPKGTDRTAESRLHLELSKMEVEAGLGFSPQASEIFLSQTSLIHFRNGLATDELFLSFHVGAKASYLWAVGREGMRLYVLPPAAVLETRVGAFRRAVYEGRPEASRLGASLYQLLFGRLSANEAGKHSWLLSLEGKLFELPFAALAVGAAPGSAGGRGGEMEYVVERHSLQIVPGALLLNSRRGRPGGKHLAVGDPIYNPADPRLEREPWYREPWYKDLSGWWSRTWSSATADGLTRPLNRLAGSGAEIRNSAQVWRTAWSDLAHSGLSGPVQVLEGSAATRAAFEAALKEDAPATIHLATHVVVSQLHPEQAWLALSMATAGTTAGGITGAGPELLGVADIARLDASGALVVMTGCTTGGGQIRPGAGLLGLTRAWLVAGARAVVSTAWPVEDAYGGLPPALYRHLATASTAEALRRGQLDMIHSGTWQAAPAYWASYQVTGGAR